MNKQKIIVLLLCAVLTISITACTKQLATTADNTESQITSESGVSDTVTSDAAPAESSAPEESTTSTAEENTSTPAQSQTPQKNTTSTQKPAENTSTETSRPSNNTSSPAQQTQPQQPPQPPESSKPAETSKPTEPANPIYTEADYNEIINTVKTYAESKTKVQFIWNGSLSMNGMVGYHGTPSLTQRGKAKVIETLKYHVDLTEDLAYSQSGQGASANYKIIWYQKNGEILFALLYG